MISTCFRLPIPAALILCLLPGSLLAESFGFCNDCRVPVIVQIASVQRGMLKRDQILLRAGESTPTMPLNSDKVITVCDGKTGRVLFRDALRMNSTPQNFSITPDPRMPTRVRMVATPATPPPDMPPAERPKPPRR
ncbi:MAG: hypothetical protein U0840_27730 [Gemmataceae bacterium]